jgi:hypothetical protein
MASTRGRQVVVPLTNKSGGAVVAGDVVVVDTTNNDAFTTTTSAGFTGGIGVAQESLANNAVGRVLISGYAALVNVNASVTRGHFGFTHTVAKQAAGASARGAGSFCQFLTGGTTPDAIVYPSDLAAAALTDPTTTRGDIITRGAASIGRLALGATGKVLRSDGTDAVWGYPPGHEYDYAQITSGVTVTATSEATADTVVTANAVTYDGSTAVMLEFFTTFVQSPVNGAFPSLWLYDGATSIGRWAPFFISNSPSTLTNLYIPMYLKRRITPSAAAHTYSVRASQSGAASSTITAGSGGAGADQPTFIRQTKAN